MITTTAPPAPHLSNPTTEAVIAEVKAAAARLAVGGIVIVTDDADRENEGDLVMAAECMTQETMAFFIRHGTGIVCVPVDADRLTELDLPPMVGENTELHQTAFTVSVDHKSVGTGVSAADRAATVRALAEPTTQAGDFRRPGHIFPLRARDGGVMRRAGHTEAALDLLRLAGRTPVGAIVELINDDGSMARADDLSTFAADHDLPMVSIANLLRYRRACEQQVVETGASRLPTTFGVFRAVAFRSLMDDTEHLALVMGAVADVGRRPEGVLVRVHSECLTGDVMSSTRCDCGYQLEQSMDLIATEGCGVVVYLRGHEGRGIGLGHKLRAYALQELGRDTVDANEELGLPVDGRDYGVGAGILNALGVRRARLITNNPTKYGGLQGYGLDIVRRVSTPPSVTAENVRYLRTKRDRLAHHLEFEEAVVTTAVASP